MEEGKGGEGESGREERKKKRLVRMDTPVRPASVTVHLLLASLKYLYATAITSVKIIKIKK